MDSKSFTMPNRLAQINEQIGRFPNEPGVYLMKDRLGAPIYIGKAKNLRQRVKSYFRASGDNRAFIPLLEKYLFQIDYIVTLDEKEALLLENDLIKEHWPKFNVLLKDDKNFIRLKLDLNQTWPRFEMVRTIKRQVNVIYFGPYSSARSIRQTLKVVNRYFQLRTCSNKNFNSPRSCLQHQMKRCSAPCLGQVDREQYRQQLKGAIMFLRGRGQEVCAAIEQEMMSLAGQLRFEEAAQLRDRIKMIKNSLTEQKVDFANITRADVLGYYREGSCAEICLLQIRNQRMLSSQGHSLEQFFQDDGEMLRDFILNFYSQKQMDAKILVCPFKAADQAVIEELLAESCSLRVEVRVPCRGELRRLVLMANRNAQSNFREKRRPQQAGEETVKALMGRLKLPDLPQRIEAFDISNLQGTNPVASMVVFSNGQPDKKQYRRYHIRDIQGANDFAMIFQVVSRRLQRGKKDGNLPNLMVIDGGKGQMNAAQKAMQELGLDLPLVGLAKRRPDNEDNHPDRDKNFDRIFQPGVKNPLLIRSNSPEFFLLQSIRDESHRFAIDFHRQTRKKSRINSLLLAIEGIGPKRSQRLLKHFGGLKKVKQASRTDLQEVEGISPRLAELIYSHWRL